MMSASEELNRAVGRIEGNTESILQRLDSIDNRVGKVERKVHWWSGVAAAVSIVIGSALGHGRH